MKKFFTNKSNFGYLVGIVTGIFLVRFNVGLFVFLSGVVSAAIFFIPSILAHELGHLIFGKLTGYTFSSFRLGSFAWYKEDDRIRFKLSKNFAAGQCLMKPVESFEDFQFVLYNLGGVIVNLVLALSLSILAILQMPNGERPGLFIFFIAGAVVNLYFFIVNLLPIKSLGNDGANIREALKSKDAARGLYTIFYVNAKLAEGKTMQDFDDSLFEINGDEKVKNYLEAYLLLYKAAKLEARGEYGAFIECHNRIDITNLPNPVKYAVKADSLYYYTLYAPDHNKARELFADADIQKFLKTGLLGTARIAAAYAFFVEENPKKAHKLLEQAKKIAQNFPNKGQRLSEEATIQMLEEAMNVLS